MIPVSLYAFLRSGHPTSPCLLPPASQLPYQAACHFYKAPPLQEALQDCSAETAWLCLNSRWPFRCLCPSHEKDAKEEDWDVHTGAIQGPERVSYFPKVSPQKAFSCHPRFFMEALSSLSFLTILFPSHQVSTLSARD